MEVVSSFPQLRARKIAFVTYGYPLDVSAMLLNSLALLREHNHVDVIVAPVDTRHALCPQWLHEDYIYSPEYKNFFYRAARKLFRIFAPYVSARSAVLAWKMLRFDQMAFRCWFWKKMRQAQYDMVIAVEAEALITVAAAVPNSAALIYYNMELLDWNEDNPLYTDKRLFKELEYDALKRVDHVMITSPLRAEIFCKMNQYPLDKVSVLPVVPMRIEQELHSDYFRNKFAIADDKKIVLYSGNFQPWAMCVEIIQSMHAWPKDVVLVMHTWNIAATSPDYMQQMRENSKGKPVFFSGEYIPYEELRSALSSADVGLLYYQEIDDNFTEILFSSNKFGEYMAAGLPVVCSPFPSLKDFVGQHAIGAAVPVDEIGTALKMILPKLATLRSSVVRCRKSHFEFETYFEEAFRRYNVEDI